MCITKRYGTARKNIRLCSFRSLERTKGVIDDGKKIKEDAKNMKKLKITLICLVCLFITACSNAFAKKEYDSDEKISQIEDHYAQELSVFNCVNGECSLTVSKFDGRRTLWTETLDKSQNIDIKFSFSLSNGMAKIVHIDVNGNVTTIIECSPDTSADGFITKTVSLKKGQNRLKIIGYDCEDIDCKMLFTEP